MSGNLINLADQGTCSVNAINLIEQLDKPDLSLHDSTMRVMDGTMGTESTTDHCAYHICWISPRTTPSTALTGVPAHVTKTRNNGCVRTLLISSCENEVDEEPTTGWTVKPFWSSMRTWLTDYYPMKLWD